MQPFTESQGQNFFIHPIKRKLLDGKNKFFSVNAATLTHIFETYWLYFSFLQSISHASTCNGFLVFDKPNTIWQNEGKSSEISFSKSNFQSEFCAKHKWFINFWNLATGLFARMGKISSLETFCFLCTLNIEQINDSHDNIHFHFFFLNNRFNHISN